MTISVVLIVKNEETLLARCLDSVKGVDEIVIVDTGSTDKTLEIANRYTQNIHHFPWNDSFADARNIAKTHANSDWILSIDADEYLHDLSKVREAIAEAEKRNAFAVDITMVAEDKSAFDKQHTFEFPRLFKNSPQVWWVGDVHNHLSVLGEKLGDVRITYGYSPAHNTDPDRAFRILKKAIEKNPMDLRSIFYLAREYFYRHDYERTVILLGKYVQHSRALSEKAEAFLTMSKAYWYMGMQDSSRDACVQALIINANFKEAILHMAFIAGDESGNERWQKNADQWNKMAEAADNSDVLFVRT